MRCSVIRIWGFGVEFVLQPSLCGFNIHSYRLQNFLHVEILFLPSSSQSYLTRKPFSIIPINFF